MGFYRNGFVFTSEPAWKALAKLSPEVGLTGYQHKKREVWLLDAWNCRTRQKRWPFANEFELTAPPIAAVEKTLKRICDAAGESLYGVAYLRLAAQFSKLLGAATFFFAADDDMIEMAAVAEGGVLSRFRIRLEMWAIEYKDGAFRAIPQISEDEEFSQDAADAVAEIAGVKVAKPVDVSDGWPMYGSVVALWPKAAGNPEKTLGIGTFDPFLNLERDFREVFSRPCGG